MRNLENYKQTRVGMVPYYVNEVNNRCIYVGSGSHKWFGTKNNIFSKKIKTFKSPEAAYKWFFQTGKIKGDLL